MSLTQERITNDRDWPIHAWFGLTYAAYLVLPRLALQSMPREWQQRLVDLLNEAEASGIETPGNYDVRLRGADGKFVPDWRADYRHGRYPTALVVAS